jgi:uncharacterized protein (TIGR00725 family)
VADSSKALRIVSVAGSSDASESETAFAFELGRLLALEGYAVACGGGSGAMEAACRGAREAGGTVLGVLPGSDPADANPFVNIAIPTGLGSGRNRIVALAGFALVAVGGRHGTLSEIAFALEAGRPVCAFGTWSGLPGVAPVLTAQEALLFLKQSEEVRGC